MSHFKSLGNTTIKTKISSAEEYKKTGQIPAVLGVFNPEYFFPACHTKYQNIS
jgi:hypothetical protein